MDSILYEAYRDALYMFEDFLRKTPDANWRGGSDDYLVPARIAYHIFMSVEWLTARLPREEHLQARRYNLNWLGPVDSMPSREQMLADLAWARGLLDDWFVEWAEEDDAGPDGKKRLEKAVYFLRHIQHHIGELSVVARLQGFDSPEWK